MNTWDMNEIRMNTWDIREDWGACLGIMSKFDKIDF